MVKRLFLLSLLVLALCGASTVMSFAGGPPLAGIAYMPPPPGPPPVCGPAATNYSPGKGRNRPCSSAAEKSAEWLLLI